MLCYWQEDGGSLLMTSFMAITEQRHKVPRLSKRLFVFFDVKIKNNNFQFSTFNFQLEKIMSKIAVAGTGYVGLSIATLLAQNNQVTAVDVIPEKVEKINNRISPIQDEYIEKYLKEKDLNLTATLDGKAAYKDADFVVIAAPTNYDSVKNFFDTHHIEDVIDLVLSVNPDAVMVIKSTIPVGYTVSVREKYSYRERQADGSFRLSPPRLSSPPSSSANPRPSTIISTPPASSSAMTTPLSKPPPTPSPPSLSKVP